MTTAVMPAPETALPPVTPEITVPRGWRLTEVASSLATRLSFVALAWVLIAEQTSWLQAGLVLAVQTAAYLLALPLALRVLAGNDAWPVSIASQLASAFAIALASFMTTTTIALPIMAGVVGALRALADTATNVVSGAMAGATTTEIPQRSGKAKRENLIRLASVAAGALLGVVATWLGVFWLVAVLCAVAAAQIALAGPTGSQPTAEPVTDVDGQPGVPSSAIVVFLAGLLAFAAAVILIGVWIREVFQPLGVSASAYALGALGGAFILGLVGGSVVATAQAAAPLRALLIGVGFLIGAGALALSVGLLPAHLLLLVVAMVAGLAIASVTPIPGLKLTPAASAASRGRVGALAAGAGVLATPVAGLGAVWLAEHAPLVAALIVATACYLAVMLIPVFAQPQWRQVQPWLDQPVALLRRTPKLPARLSVTLIYVDGQWLVEVRKGRALLGTRYLVKPDEALDMLARLDVPALTSRVEQALSSDKTEAGRQVDRMRAELADLESKLSRLTEMVDLSERGKPVPDPDSVTPR